MSERMRDYGVVVIARDEERNMEGCLKAIHDTDDVTIVVVVDSRTKDNTSDIARRYTPNVLITDGNRGRLRNTGYCGLNLPYVLYVDADMRLTPGYVEALRRMMEKDTKQAIVGGAQIPKGGSLLGRLEGEYWNYRKAVGVGGAMYRTEALEDAGGFNDDLNVGEDGELQHRLIGLGWKCSWTGDAFIEHHYANSSKVWLNKMSHGLGSGPSFRGVIRLIASPMMGIHAAWVRRSPCMLWYVPVRSIVILFGPGNKEEYIPSQG